MYEPTAIPAAMRAAVIQTAAVEPTVSAVSWRGEMGKTYKDRQPEKKSDREEENINTTIEIASIRGGLLLEIKNVSPLLEKNLLQKIVQFKIRLFFTRVISKRKKLRIYVKM